MFWIFFLFFFSFFQNTGSQLYLSVCFFCFFFPVSVHSLHDTQFGSVITLIYHAIKIRNAVDMKKQFCSHTVCVLENAFSVSVYTVFYLFIPVAQGNSVFLLTRRTRHWVHQLETKTKGGGGRLRARIRTENLSIVSWLPVPQYEPCFYDMASHFLCQMKKETEDS